MASPWSRTAPIVWLATACTYPALSPHLAEGTHVLRRGEIGVTVSGAGGAGTHAITGNSATSLGAGVETRVRIGMATDQEIGVALGGGISTKMTGEPPVVFGGALSYKIAPRPWLAFVGELGALDKVISSTLIFGGSLAAIVAVYDDGEDQVYTGLKGSLGIPRLRGARGNAEIGGAAAGYSKRITDRARLVVEGGIFVGIGDVDSGGTTTSTTGLGGYLLLSFGYRVR